MKQRLKMKLKNNNHELLEKQMHPAAREQCISDFTIYLFTLVLLFLILKYADTTFTT